MRRSILYRNPPLIDDEGYEISSDDDADRIADAELAAADLNPYSNIHLEREFFFSALFGLAVGIVGMLQD